MVQVGWGFTVNKDMVNHFEEGVFVFMDDVCVTSHNWPCTVMIGQYPQNDFVFDNFFYEEWFSKQISMQCGHM